MLFLFSAFTPHSRHALAIFSKISRLLRRSITRYPLTFFRVPSIVVGVLHRRLSMAVSYSLDTNGPSSIFGRKPREPPGAVLLLLRN